jgi:hypothetical protein
MATQPTGKPPEQHRISIFPRWLRFVFIALALIFLSTLAIFWIRGVSSDQDKVMTAIFVSLTAIFAFFAMPFLYHSERSEPSPSSVSTSFPPVEFTINNQFQPGTQQPSFASAPNSTIGSGKELDDQNATPNTNTPSRQQQPSENPPIVNSPASPAPVSSQFVQRNESSQLDRDDLLDLLTNCLPSVFSKVVFFSGVPDGTLSGEGTAQAVRATELIRWAEHGSLGLQKLYEVYQRAEYGKKKFK